MNRLANAWLFTRAQVRRLAHDIAGATAIEYAIIASGVAVAVAATVYNLGSTLNSLFATVVF